MYGRTRASEKVRIDRDTGGSRRPREPALAHPEAVNVGGRSDERDAPVAEPDEMLRRHSTRALGVAHNARPALGWLVDEHDVDAIQQLFRDGRGAGGVEDDAVDLAGAEGFEVLVDAGAALLAEEDGIALLDRDPLRAADYVGEELVREVGDDESDGVGAASDETLCDDVWPVTELFGGLENALAGIGGDARGWISGQHERDGRLGYTSARRDIVGGYAPLCGG